MPPPGMLPVKMNGKSLQPRFRYTVDISIQGWFSLKKFGRHKTPDKINRFETIKFMMEQQ